jgi:hypothetical protein
MRKQQRKIYFFFIKPEKPMYAIKFPADNIETYMRYGSMEVCINADLDMIIDGLILAVGAEDLAKALFKCNPHITVRDILPELQSMQEQWEETHGCSLERLQNPMLETA